MKRRLIALLLCAVFVLGLSACGENQSAQNDTNTNTNGSSQEASSNDAVVIENMGITTVYEKAPESAVTLSYSIAEIMVALGLEDKLVATAPSMYILDQVSEEYRDKVGSLPLLEGNYGVPSLETVLATNAEFVFGDSYSFYASNVGTPEDFETAGVKIYATEGTCVSNPTFENTYNDIMNIGKIFRVEDRAEELVSELKAREKAVKGE